MVNFKKGIAAAATFAVSSAIFVAPAKAQSLLPDALSNVFGLLGEDGAGATSFVTSRVSFGMFLMFMGVIFMGVVYALLATYKYIRSEGDAGKMEEAQAGIKAIMYGIAAMFIGIVGMVLVVVFFGGTRPPSELYQVCLVATDSEGCQNCIKEGAERNSDGGAVNQCAICEDQYKAVAAGDDAETTLTDECRDKVTSNN